MPLSFRQAGNLFVGGPNINIYSSGNTFAISGSAAGVISGTNLGTGIAVFSGVAGTNMIFRTLRGGLNANVSLSGNNIIFSATTGAINGITALTNFGGGIAVASSVTNNTLLSRTLSGTNGIEVVEAGNVVVIKPSSSLTSNRLVIAGTGGALTTNDFYQVDNTVGSMAIGFSTPQTLTNTRLLLPPATSAITPLIIGTSTVIGFGANRNGDIQYISTGNTLYFYKGTTFFNLANTLTPFLFKAGNLFLTGTASNRVLQADSLGNITAFNTYFTPLGIFNSITSTTITGTSELSILNTGSTLLLGTNILNSSSHITNPQLVTGKKYRFNARGTINTDISPGDLLAKMKLGSLVVASSTTQLQSSINGNFFEIDCTFTIRSQGASGTVVGSGKMLTDFQYLNLGTSPIAPITSLGVRTINTTVDTPFDFTLENSSTGNVITIDEATLEYLN